MQALIRFTGAQTGSATIQFTLPGFYIVENLCTGTTFVRLQPSNGTGNSIGAPPGKKCHVFHDGTHMDYVDMPDPGSAYDLHTNTTTLPPWMTCCTNLPYLLKDGTVYSTASYTALAALLGSTYGGNGVTTFGVPDESNRFRLAVATSGVSRVTFPIAGVTGSLLGGAGGDQRLQSHTHSNTLSDPGHVHTSSLPAFPGSNFATGGGWASVGQNTASQSSTTNVTITNANVGTGSSQNMPPFIVSFVALIKT